MVREGSEGVRSEQNRGQTGRETGQSGDRTGRQTGKSSAEGWEEETVNYRASDNDGGGGRAGSDDRW